MIDIQSVLIEYERGNLSYGEALDHLCRIGMSDARARELLDPHEPAVAIRDRHEVRIQRAVYEGDLKNALKRVKTFKATFPDGVIPLQVCDSLMKRLEFAVDYKSGGEYPLILTAVLDCASTYERVPELAVPNYIAVCT